MRNLLFAALIAIVPTSVLASDFGVSINIGQPGFYGQINLGNNYPRPQVIYPQPVLVREVRRHEWEHQSPVYLHVPASHSRNWRQHCHRYQACNLPVYFVRENWYNDVYSPHYNEYSNRRHSVDYRERGHDSYGGHDDHYQEQHYDSHRDSHYKEKRRDKREHRYNKDDHRGKHDKGHNGKKHRDRDH